MKKKLISKKKKYRHCEEADAVLAGCLAGLMISGAISDIQDIQKAISMMIDSIDAVGYKIVKK